MFWRISAQRANGIRFSRAVRPSSRTVACQNIEMRIALLPLVLLSPIFAQQFDLVVTGGRIADGSGDPWFYSDLGVKGDSIAALGSLASASAARRIDARGLVVAPGFIDIHTH